MTEAINQRNSEFVKVPREVYDLFRNAGYETRTVEQFFEALAYKAETAGGVLTPASTVESETTFGIAAAVGVDTEYARQDHTHGSPTNPVTAHESKYDHPGYDTHLAASNPHSGAWPVALTDTHIPYDNSGAPGDTNLTYDGSNTVTLAASGKFVYNAVSGGPANNTSFYNPATSSLANFAFMATYPNGGTNVGMAFQVIPRGTGFSANLKSQLSLFNTDFVADPVNYEFLSIRGAGTRFVIGSAALGSGTVRPIHFEIQNNQEMMVIDTTGYVGIGDNFTSPVYRLHVDGEIGINERSSDPTAASEGEAVLWNSDGTATGNDGDILFSRQASSVTQKGCLQYTDFTPSSVTVTTGGTPVGTVADMQTMFDGNVYQVPEVTGIPGYDIRCNFTNIDRYPQFLVCRWWYDGSATHYSTIDLYNYNTTSWDQVRMFKDGISYYDSLTMYIPLSVNDDYVDGSGNAIVRFYHHTTGNATHNIYIDYAGLTHSLQGVI